MMLRAFVQRGGEMVTVRTSPPNTTADGDAVVAIGPALPLELPTHACPLKGVGDWFSEPLAGTTTWGCQIPDVRCPKYLHILLHLTLFLDYVRCVTQCKQLWE